MRIRDSALKRDPRGLAASPVGTRQNQPKPEGGKCRMISCVNGRTVTPTHPRAKLSELVYTISSDLN
jgi:hypothetical protein